MKKKIELTISTDYVPDWTVVDAVRELFQNAIDQEAVGIDNAMSWSFDNGVLRICNKNSTLTTSSLLFGSTTKATDSRAIGQFGEGYKLAALVLLREGKELVIYNYGTREVWRPRMVKSRRFGADVLTFFIETEAPWASVPSNNLTIEVRGITEEEWAVSIVPSNLHILGEYNVLHESAVGQIIDNPSLVGNVYVNGLFVCKYNAYKFGYNFKPGHLKLDRDRRLASDFDLQWLSSSLWSSMNTLSVLELIEQGLPDVKYVGIMTYDNVLSDEAYSRFRVSYGPNAVPVTTQHDADSLPTGYIPIIVTPEYQSLIKSSAAYEEPDDPRPPLWERFRSWMYEEAYDYVPEEVFTMFMELVDELKEVLE